MRVEVEIGTIQVDALPEGVTVDALRTEIIAGLTAHLEAGGIAGVESAKGVVTSSAEPREFDSLGAQIAHKIFGELG